MRYYLYKKGLKMLSIKKEFILNASAARNNSDNKFKGLA